MLRKQLAELGDLLAIDRLCVLVCVRVCMRGVGKVLLTRKYLNETIMLHQTYTSDGNFYSNIQPHSGSLLAGNTSEVYGENYQRLVTFPSRSLVPRRAPGNEATITGERTMTLRCALYALNNKVGWTVVTDRNCRAAFGEKLFVTAGNGHPTAIQRTAFRVFVTVVTTLFQEMDTHCHATRGIATLISLCCFILWFINFCIHI